MDEIIVLSASICHSACMYVCIKRKVFYLSNWKAKWRRAYTRKYNSYSIESLVESVGSGWGGEGGGGSSGARRRRWRSGRWRKAIHLLGNGVWRELVSSGKVVSLCVPLPPSIHPPSTSTASTLLPLYIQKISSLPLHNSTDFTHHGLRRKAVVDGLY